MKVVSDDHLLPMTATPDNIRVFVVGGPGKQSSVIPSWGMTRSVTIRSRARSARPSRHIRTETPPESRRSDHERRRVNPHRVCDDLSTRRLPRSPHRRLSPSPCRSSAFESPFWITANQLQRRIDAGWPDPFGSCGHRGLRGDEEGSTGNVGQRGDPLRSRHFRANTQ